MSTKKSTERRKVLIGLGGGIVGANQLPGSWAKPVVDAVILPSHAETTDDSGALPPETPAPTPTQFSGSFDLNPIGGADNRPIDDVLSILVPEAYAGETVSSGQMCIDTSGAPGFEAKGSLIGEGDFYYSGSGTIGGAAVLLTAHECNSNGGTAVSLTVTSVSAAGADYVITVASGSVGANGTLPEGSVCPSEPVC